MYDTALLVKISDAVGDLEDDVTRELLAEIRELDT